MRRNILVVVMLVMMLPTFGQKLNSRGEKMVSSVYVYEQGKKLGNTYEFEYDEQGNMLSVKMTREKSCYVVAKNSDQVSITYYYNGEKKCGNETYIIKLNDQGLISQFKRIDTKQSKRIYTYELDEYDYSYEPSLKRFTISKNVNTTLWVHSDGKDVNMGGEDSFFYIYKNGNLNQLCNGNMTHHIYGDRLCDLNVSMTALCCHGMSKNVGITTLLYLTPWSPFYSKNILTMHINDQGKRTIFYEYDYYDNNIVAIREYRDMGKGEQPYLRSIAKINYVEE